MPKPELTFFTELSPRDLAELFKGRFVIDDLQALDAALSLAIIDFSEERAAVVKRLNEAGIPVIAWLLLPEEEGYWLNAGNYEQAAARYISFKAWTTEHELKWAGMGLDIEADINDLKQLMDQEQAQKFLPIIFQRLRNKSRVDRGKKAYQALVDLIHADGYPVESYQIPLISEERRAKATVLQRATGIVDVETDREVLMLYSSFLRPDGAAVLYSYAPEADSVGVGSTGGGVDIPGVVDLDPLSWEELTRDLRLCVGQEKPIHIFSLEGCAQQGFLSKLTTIDWDAPVDVPEGTHKIRLIRTWITAGLWLLERPWVILLSLATLIGLGFLFTRKKHKQS